MKLAPGALRTNPLARAFALLMGAHFVGLFVPLLTIPWLARQLGPGGWAPVLVAQSLAGWAILLLEFGFDLAGTRAVAQATDPAATGRAAARVQRARLLLTPVVAILTLVAGVALPGLRWELLLGTVLFVVARGLSPYWYYQGVRRLRFATTVETLGKLVPAAALLVLVTEPEHAWRVLALQGGGAAIATALLTWRLHRQVELPPVTNDAALGALREAAPMFGARAASGLYLQANTLLLTLMAGPLAVAAYGGAERVIRAAINLLAPVTQAFFPHVSRLAASDAAGARRAVKRALLVLVGLAVAGAGFAALLAPLVVRILLGEGYDSAVPVLRLLVLVIPLVAAGTVVGIYWALPLHRERLFLGAVVTGGVVNLVAAMLLVPRAGALGMATSVVLAESVVTAVLVTAFVRSGR